MNPSTLPRSGSGRQATIEGKAWALAVDGKLNHDCINGLFCSRKDAVEYHEECMGETVVRVRYRIEVIGDKP